MRDLLGSDEPGARLAVDYFVYQRGQGDRRARGRARRPRRRWCSPPASARTRPRSAAGSARRRPGSASSSTPTRTRSKGPRISAAGSRVSAWVIPTNEELMIARHTGVLLGLIEAARLTGRQAKEHDMTGDRHAEPNAAATAFAVGTDSRRASGRRRSTSATSSSRTTSRTTATSRSWRRRPRARRRSGTS